MIRFENVSKSYRTISSRKIVLHDTSCEFDINSNIGILGVNGAGKSTLMRLLAGSEMPDRGRIARTCRVSFPLAFDGTIHPKLTGRENVSFIARIYGHRPKPIIDYVADFAELGAYFDMPTETYSSGMKARLSFGLCLAIHFDVYLVDEITAVGDTRFQARCRTAFQDRTKNSSVIMVSHSFDTIHAYCDSGAVLDSGVLTFYKKIDDAIDAYRHIVGVIPA